MNDELNLKAELILRHCEQHQEFAEAAAKLALTLAEAYRHAVELATSASTPAIIDPEKRTDILLELSDANGVLGLLQSQWRSAYHCARPTAEAITRKRCELDEEIKAAGGLDLTTDAGRKLTALLSEIDQLETRTRELQEAIATDMQKAIVTGEGQKSPIKRK
jgi:hypothetical protein